MKTRFFRLSGLLGLLGLLGPAAAQDTSSSAWRVSFAAGVTNDGAKLDATEIRQFAAFGEPIALYAAASGWMDQGETKGSGKVLRLDGPDKRWTLEVDFNQFCPAETPRCALATGALQAVNWKATESGAKVNVWTLLASTWGQGQSPNPAKVYSKNNSDGQWYETVLDPTHAGQVRVFASHEDKAAGQFYGFAAGKGGVWRGQLSDKRGAGQEIVKWSEREGDWPAVDDPQCSGGGRVVGLAEARGRLFASVCWTILERQDGRQGACKPSEVETPQGGCEARWRPFWTEPRPCSSETGLRGLTTITIEGQQYLIAGAEGACAKVERIDPANASSTVELDLADFLESHWKAPIGYIIAGYNSPLPLVYDAAGRGRRLIGLEAFVPARPPGHAVVVKDDGSTMESGGWIIKRNAAASYELMRVPAITPWPMVAIRDAIASPWASECDEGGHDCVVYLAGFDANKSAEQTPCAADPCDVLPKVPTHGTGFVVKGRFR